MEIDLQPIVHSFSALLGVETDIGRVLLATVSAYTVLVIWGIDRAIRKRRGVDLPPPAREEIIFRGERAAPEAESRLEPIEMVVPEQVELVEEPKPSERTEPHHTEAPQPLSQRLTKTRAGFFEKIRGVFISKPKLDPEMVEELEYLLVTSDLGVKTVSKLVDEVKANLHKGTEVTEELLVAQLKSRLTAILGESADEPLESVLPRGGEGPLILMLVGVNGAGKTTTSAKLAARLQGQGRKVMLVAADTFRAAAVQQLRSWGERLGIPVHSGAENAKPQAVVFDAMVVAKEESYDVVLIDTAGRLHTKSNLMQELEGVRNTIQRHYPEGPHEVLLVVDGSTGQNAINQAREFHEAVRLTGLVVTKLDGTPKGGIVVAIKEEFGIPVRYIGVGESPADLRPFKAPEFVEALFDRSAPSLEEKVSAHGETRRRRRRGGEAGDHTAPS